MLTPERSSILVKIGIAALGGVALAWFLNGPEWHMQVGAGIALLTFITGIVVVDLATERFQIWNVKYFVLASYAMFLGIGMLLDLGDEAYYFSGRAIGLTFGALSCFLVGFHWQHSRSNRGGHKPAVFWLTESQLFFTAILFYLLGFGFLYAEWRLFGQVYSYSGQIVSPRGNPGPPAPLVHVLAQLSGPASLIALVTIRRGTSPARKLVLFMLLALTVGWYLLWGARENFLALGIAALIVWSEIPEADGAHRLGATPILALGLAGAIMIGLSVLRANWDFSRARAEGLAGAFDKIRESLNMFGELRRTLDFFPGHMKYLDGYSFYGLATSAIPRMWWPDKPVGVGKLTSIIYDRNPDSSIALSLPGELYANFGIWGSLFGMLLFGCLAGAVYRWYARRRGRSAALVIYVQLVICMFAEVRGDILDATVPVIYHLLPVIMTFSVFAVLNRLLAREGMVAGVPMSPEGA